MIFTLKPPCDLLAKALVLITWTISFTHALPRVSVTTPVNFVPEGGIFSVHCRIYNLEIDHGVELVRTYDSSSQRLSVDTEVIVKDERFFLAVRNLPDGSIVYFMSLMDVRRDDEASYGCKVISVYPRIAEIASDSKQLHVTFFPSKTDPSCEVDGNSLHVQEGVPVTFRCSAENGRPQIKLRWSRAAGSTKQIEESWSEIRNDRKHSTLTFTPSVDDDGSIFFCRIVSSAFPGREPNCHLGPLSVIPDASVPRTNSIKINKKSEVTDSNSILDIDPMMATPGSLPRDYTTDCHQKCPGIYESNTLHWVIATIVTSFIAIIFLIIVIALALQYNHQNVQQKRHRTTYVAAPQQHRVTEDIYTSLERNVEHGKMYMMLDNAPQRLQICAPEEP